MIWSPSTLMNLVQKIRALCDPGQVDKLDPKLPWLEKAKGDDEGLFSRIVEHEELIS